MFKVNNKHNKIIFGLRFFCWKATYAFPLLLKDEDIKKMGDKMDI